MIRLRYSTDKNSQCDIGGSSSDLRTLYDQITDFANDQSRSMSIETERNFDPSPYEKLLSRLEFTKTASLINIYVVEDVLRIEAKPELITLFANNLPHDVQYPENGYHVHFDPISREGYVAPNSIELILTLSVD